MNLYELSAGYNQIFDMAMDEEADLNVLEDTLQSIEGGIEVKVENGIKLIKSLQAFADNVKKEQEFHKKRHEVLKKRIKRIKEYYRENLAFIGKDKISTTVGTMAVQKSTPALKIVQELLPVEYLTIIPQSYEANTEKIKLDLKAGKEIPGAQLVQGHHLRIR